ncbi:MAG: penicillin acylase family protein, partial [Bacteroidota bacterium]
MKKGHKLLVTTILLLSIILLFNTRFGNIPPLGKFFNPFTGIWQNALISDIPKGETIHLQGLRDEVNVVFNQRGVPHIFANNEHDLYFITGYVTAMHRLWQMEFGTHASLGRLAEVVGERALEYDRYIRRMGMAYGAERYLASAMECDTTMLALNAYSAGVNAWISRLTPKNLPFEYKLL